MTRPRQPRPRRRGLGPLHDLTPSEVRQAGLTVTGAAITAGLPPGALGEVLTALGIKTAATTARRTAPAPIGHRPRGRCGTCRRRVTLSLRTGRINAHPRTKRGGGRCSGTGTLPVHDIRRDAA